MLWTASIQHHTPPSQSPLPKQSNNEHREDSSVWLKLAQQNTILICKILHDLTKFLQDFETILQDVIKFHIMQGLHYDLEFEASCTILHKLVKILLLGSLYQSIGQVVITKLLCVLGHHFDSQNSHFF